MGKIRFFLGRNVDARQQLLKNRMVSAGTCSFLHLIPTKGRIMELESENHFWLRRRAETLTGMVHGIFEKNIRQEKYQDHRFIDESLRLRMKNGRSIAREIKKIIKEDGLDLSCDLGRIRVIFPDLNVYSSLISEIFQEYGIPFSLTKGLPLHSHPLAGLFCSIFEVPLNGYQREDIFKLFSSEILYKDLTDTSESISFIEFFGKEFLFSGDDALKIESIVKSYSTRHGLNKPGY